MRYKLGISIFMSRKIYCLFFYLPRFVTLQSSQSAHIIFSLTHWWTLQCFLFLDIIKKLCWIECAHKLFFYKDTLLLIPGLSEILISVDIDKPRLKVTSILNTQQHISISNSSPPGMNRDFNIFFHLLY